MRTILAIALLIAAPAWAQDADLRGQWKVTVPSQPTYSGTVLVDAERRATWNSPLDNGRPAKYQGYIAGLDGPKVEILLTDRVGVAHVHCMIQSSDLMVCHTVRDDGVRTAAYVLTRIGRGPDKLMPVLPSRVGAN